jgi:hypothetical protein
MIMQLGKMYLVKELFWFLYPTKELATEGRAKAAVVGTAKLVVGGVAGRWSATNAKLLSERYKCNVFVVEENTCVVLLEVDDDYYKLLDSNGNIGWIICQDFSNYFEIVKE